jgi:hypothetical protein
LRRARSCQQFSHFAFFPSTAVNLSSI